MVTIKDVAFAAGVSATTVSNVIHGYHSRVSRETADKILAVIDELGYIPNMSARSLVSRSSHVIALINHLPVEKTPDLILDPFYLRAISQIESSMRESGYYLMLRTCNTSRELITFLQNWNADGLFISGPIGKDFAEALSRSGKPALLIDNLYSGEEFSYVIQDDYQGGVLEAEHLLANGHTKVGYAVTAPQGNTIFCKRLHGFMDALEKAGHPLTENRIFKCDSQSLASSLSLVGPVERAVSDGMTALGVCSDELAIILIAQLRKAGFSLPQQLSVIGFGDLPQGVFTNPALTTIHYDVEEKAALAVSGMLRLLSGEQTEPTRVLLPVTIVERDSVCSL